MVLLLSRVVKHSIIYKVFQEGWHQVQEEVRKMEIFFSRCNGVFNLSLKAFLCMLNLCADTHLQYNAALT